MVNEPLQDELFSTRIIRPFHTVAFIVKTTEVEPHYLLIRRCSDYLNGNWQMVSGGIEQDETAWQAAYREIKEETNLIPNRLYSADMVEYFYEFAFDSIVMAPVFIAFIDHEQSVQLSPTEHDDYAWLTFDQACERLEFSNQQRIISHIHSQFVNRLPNERFRISIPEFAGIE